MSRGYCYRPPVVEAEEEKLKKMKFMWRPRPGTFFFRHYKTGQWMRLRIQKEEDKEDRFYNFDSSGVSRTQWEVINIDMIGNSAKVLNDLISEAHAEYMEQNEGKAVVYRYSNDDRMWKVFGNPKNKRPWKTIVTQGTIKEDLLQDISTFRRSGEWYNVRGIPYRRGYLLHGPPGTGKSSLVYSLASALNSSICVLTLSDSRLTDDDFMDRLATAPSNSIILIEDIDVALPSKKRQKAIQTEKQGKRGDMRNKNSEYKGSLTMSGVLNGIDGVTTANAQILIMTTNHKDDLDPALIRPGRYVIYFISNYHM